MPIRIIFWSFLATAVFTDLNLLQTAVATDEPVLFNRDIRPILSDKCFFCHGPDDKHREAELRFDNRDGAFADLGGYFAIVAHQPKESVAFERMSSDDEGELMPPPDSGKELSAEEIELFRRWIEQGAKYESHWSFNPPVNPVPPEVSDEKWPVNEIDQFILHRLEQNQLRPSPPADDVSLLRRLYFDLTGLPPSFEQMTRWRQGARGDRYQRVVDELFASEHFGERMAIYWLDLVRYADTVGYHGDQDHNISPYRDYVINAFNNNLPFDQFTAEQLAGDLLPEATDWQKVASGYNRLLQTTHEGGAQDKEYLAKYASDRIRNLSGVWMGATLGCTECHDHKFDPYTQKDFYSLVAFFADIKEQGAYSAPNAIPTRRIPELAFHPDGSNQLEQAKKELEQAKQKLKTLEAKLPENETGGDPKVAGDEAVLLNELKKQKSLLEKEVAISEGVLKKIESEVRWTMVTESVEPRTIRILERGDWMDTSGEVVEPAVPQFLAPLTFEGKRATRKDLAEWLTTPDHPQTARVFVNRMWYLLFGEGISRNLDDMGSQGEWPTHPQLLDWLAWDFAHSGWDVKRLMKKIVMSRTYRQSSVVTEELQAVDPDNRLFSRQGRFRLPAEMIRDNALAVSGLLVNALGGASVKPYQPEGYYAHLNFPQRKYRQGQGNELFRRGLYTHWQRQFLHPSLKAFDAPTREECTAKRPISNTPSAALVLLNDPSYVEAAIVLGIQFSKLPGDESKRITQLWNKVLQRDPSGAEEKASHKFLESQLATYRKNPGKAQQLLSIGEATRPETGNLVEGAAWTMVARALLNLNESITRN